MNLNPVLPSHNLKIGQEVLVMVDGKYRKGKVYSFSTSSPTAVRVAYCMFPGMEWAPYLRYFNAAKCR